MLCFTLKLVPFTIVIPSQSTSSLSSTSPPHHQHWTPSSSLSSDTSSEPQILSLPLIIEHLDPLPYSMFPCRWRHLLWFRCITLYCHDLHSSEHQWSPAISQAYTNFDSNLLSWLLPWVLMYPCWFPPLLPPSNGVVCSLSPTISPSIYTSL